MDLHIILDIDQTLVDNMSIDEYNKNIDKLRKPDFIKESMCTWMRPHLKELIEFLDKNVKCDFMLDDGPHTLESMKQFIKLYSQIMTDDGILIIEDVQKWEWIDILKNEVPEHLKPFIKVYDLRPLKNKYDDIVFTIDKT